MKWLRVREMVRKEFIQLFRDRKNRPLLIIAPLLQLTVFGYVVTTNIQACSGGALRSIPHRGKQAPFDAFFEKCPTFRITHSL